MAVVTAPAVTVAALATVAVAILCFGLNPCRGKPIQPRAQSKFATPDFEENG